MCYLAIANPAFFAEFRLSAVLGPSVRETIPVREQREKGSWVD
jgi:hypothetical protein